MLSRRNLACCAAVVLTVVLAVTQRQRQPARSAAQLPKATTTPIQSLEPVVTARATPTKAGVHSPSPLLAAYGNFPLHFERNDGQTDDTVRYLARGRGYELFLTGTEAVLSLRRASAGRERAVVRARLVGANHAPVIGEDALPGTSHYFIGNDPARWRTNVPHFARVTYEQVWDGIDLTYYGTNQRQLEYDFVVAPGADPDVIRLAYHGVEELSVESNGDLILQTDNGKLVQQLPAIYQVVEDERRTIEGRFALHSDNTIGFALEDYDRSLPLVIDPVLIYSTYLGGNASDDAGLGIAVDSNGNAYVTGTTSSTNFPTSGAYQSDRNGQDAFVTKLSATGNTLVYSTYIGGNGADEAGTAIAVDQNGNAYVAGRTTSTDFPTVTPAQTDEGSGELDAFVLKLSPSGAALLYSTYLGGPDTDYATGLAVDTSGCAYVTGETFSTGAFPVVSAYQSANAGGSDAFVTKLSATGDSFVYSTYFGGAENEWAPAIAIDSTGCAYIAGNTFSQGTLPVANAYQPTMPALIGGEGFLTKFSADGSSLVYSTFFGCFAVDRLHDVAVDSAGSAYIVGTSNECSVPTLNPYQVLSSGWNTFITKFSPAGNTLEYSTYLGGSGDDFGNTISVDAAGRAVVGGRTASTNFPTLDSIQTKQANDDGFITKLAATGNALIYSTLLGGNGADNVSAIALDAAGSVYLTGSTSATDFPTLNAYQTDQTGTDAFVAKIKQVWSLSINDVTEVEQNSGTHQLTFTVSLDDAACCPVTVDWETSNGSATAGQDYTAASGTLEFAEDDLTKTISITVQGDATAENDERFFITLSDPTGAVILKGTAIGAILDDDGAPPTIAITSKAIAEGNSGTAISSLPVNLSAARGLTTSVNYATSDGSAKAPDDYSSASGTITFPAWTTQSSIAFSTLGDTSPEPRETFNVALSSPTNATIATGIGTVTINDDDTAPAQTGNLGNDRNGHTATLLPDGRVLVEGQGTAEAFDPALSLWAVAGIPVESRAGHTSTLRPQGRVIAIGGTGSSFSNPSSFFPVTSVWQTLFSLNQRRSGHTTTALNDGTLVVTGGFDSAPLTTVDRLSVIFDEEIIPSAGASLPEARHRHTATRLVNGKLLVAGGESSTGVLATAFLYDPDEDSWTPTGPLSSARKSHSATLLSDGRVLVAGGSSGSSSLSSCELYDPASGTWSPTGALASARSLATAVLLGTGEVLVAGGVSGSQTLASLEVYSPTAGSWANAGQMAVARSSPTATPLPDGRILLVGAPTPNGFIAEVVDPSSPITRSAGSLNVARTGHSASLMTNGKVVVIGGGDAGYEVYDRSAGAAGTWTRTAQPEANRTEHTSTLLMSGEILVTGGVMSGAPVNTAAVVVPGSSWTATPMGGEARAGHTATLLADSTVLIVGGRTATGMATDTRRWFAGAWAGAGTPHQPRWGHTATRLATGEVLFAGGTSGTTNLRHAEIFNPDINAFGWRVVAAPGARRAGHVAVLLRDGRVLVAGGRPDAASAPLSSAEIYDPASNAWTPAASMAHARDHATATLLWNGKVLVAGGHDGTSARSDVEVWDPESDRWVTTSASGARSSHTATLLTTGEILFAGGGGSDAALFDPTGFDPSLGPEITSVTSPLSYGSDLIVLGNRLRGASEASTGGTHNSATDLPVVEMRSVEENRIVSIPYESLSSPVTSIGMSRFLFPSALDAGWHHLRVVTSGVASPSHLVEVGCSVDIASVWGPLAPVTLGQSATFTVSAQGARSYQWQRCTTGTCTEPTDWADISGATSASYTTPPVTGADAGSRFRVFVRGNCATATSSSLLLSVADTTLPNASVVFPSGGEYWVLSTAGTPPNVKGVTWTMSDDVRVCRATVSLLYSTNGGASYSAAPDTNSVVRVDVTTGGTGYVSAPSVSFSGGGGSGAAGSAVIANGSVVGVTITNGGSGYSGVPTVIFSGGGGSGATATAATGLPSTFGSGPGCSFPGEGATSLSYTVPTAFPSGQSGSLYKIRLVVTDHANNSTTVDSDAFYIVQANPDSVRTLILTNVPRMVAKQSLTPAEATLVSTKLQELANHPRVQGLVVNLDIPAIRALFTIWDADSDDAGKANAVLFSAGGIHEYLRTNLLTAYSGVRYLVLVGDDRIIPMARAKDHTVLFLESRYPAGGDLSPTATTVGQALSTDHYLTDDPLASLDAISASALDGNIVLPDLRVGRLVETPQEIVKTIATYISQDGILDLSLLDSASGHKVLVTGYDFLTSVAKEISAAWKGKLGDVSPAPEAPVDGTLAGGSWGANVSARRTALRSKLAGSGGARYGIMAIAGHATHHEEGVPGTDPHDIDGLAAADIYGADSCATPTLGALDLSGSVVYAAGCHGGLSVPGSCGSNPPDANHSLDLPQTMLSRGVVTYIANSGYGWGLRYGIGYGARLMQIFTEEMIAGDTHVVGDVVQRSKERYLAESPRPDAYDEKSIMQWTLYGLPMYAVKTVSSASATAAAPQGSVDMLGAVKVGRSISNATPVIESHGLQPKTNALPPFLLQLNLSFDFTAPGVYRKHDSTGAALPDGPGCPDVNGCYYSLNGLYDRGTGSADLPIEPYLIYDSKLSGTSQHGVLWKGGTYDEETNWRPVFAELVSNGGDGSDHGVAPRVIRARPTSPRIILGPDPPNCRASDSEINGLTLTVGEVVKENLDYSIARRYRNADLEVFYFNNTAATNGVSSVSMTSGGTGYTSAPSVSFTGGGGSGAAATAVIANGSVTGVTVTSMGSGYSVSPTITFIGGGGTGAAAVARLSGPINNCDRSGPELLAGPFNGRYESLSGTTLSFAVPAKDVLAGVWRVIVVYNFNTVNGQGRGTWIPLELFDDGAGTFRNTLSVTGAVKVTYVIQAVDNRGNVSWLDYVSVQTPSSGVPLGVAQPVERLISGTIAPPSGLTATAVTPINVALTWQPAFGAAMYDVYRSTSGTNYTKIGSSTNTTYSDIAATANTAYLYAVKAVDAVGNASAFSAPDPATTVIFTDATLSGTVTTIKRVHLVELRTAVNAFRTLAGLSAATVTDPVITIQSTKAKTAHITELRNALNAARAALAFNAWIYTDPTLTTLTRIKALHINDLRNAVK